MVSEGYKAMENTLAGVMHNEKYCGGLFNTMANSCSFEDLSFWMKMHQESIGNVRAIDA